MSKNIKYPLMNDTNYKYQGLLIDSLYDKLSYEQKSQVTLSITVTKRIKMT